MEESLLQAFMAFVFSVSKCVEFRWRRDTETAMDTRARQEVNCLLEDVYFQLNCLTFLNFTDIFQFFQCSGKTRRHQLMIANLIINLIR